MNRSLIVYSPSQKPSETEKNEIIDFLFTHLENYGDPLNDITLAINYALKEIDSFGGVVLVTREDHQIVGAVIINNTGMKGYIPSHILVYIAVHKNYRGKRLGLFLMNKAIEFTKGDIALHVEEDNPAKYLYEKIGFKNKYLEMRFKREEI